MEEHLSGAKDESSGEALAVTSETPAPEIGSSAVLEESPAKTVNVENEAQASGTSATGLTVLPDTGGPRSVGLFAGVLLMAGAVLARRGLR